MRVTSPLIEAYDAWLEAARSVSNWEGLIACIKHAKASLTSADFDQWVKDNRKDK